MIQQMDKVFSSAYVTIIAAAGQDAHAGLPGVSRVHRTQLQDANISGVHFVQLPRPALATIMSSHWAERGWTFQECCLAGRRLIFAEDQAIFLCNELFVVESVKPQIYDNQKERYRLKDHKLYQFEHLIRRQMTQENMSRHLFNQIREYSGRKISYDSDSLNAFLGVLHQWESGLSETKKPMSHLWGLPIRGAIGHGPGIIDFYIMWSHTYHNAARRPGFPSWSWTGWEGRKAFSSSPIQLDETKQRQTRFGDIYMSVQSDGQETQKLADFHENSVARIRKAQYHQPGPTRLLITCAVFPVRVKHFHLSQDQRDVRTELLLNKTTKTIIRPQSGDLCLFRVFEKVQVGIPGALDQQVQPDERLSGLLLNYSFLRYFLVVKEVGEGLYERVGLFTWSHVDFDKLFLNEDDQILDRVTLPRKRFFPTEFERRTMCLV